MLVIKHSLRSHFYKESINPLMLGPWYNLDSCLGISVEMEVRCVVYQEYNIKVIYRKY